MSEHWRDLERRNNALAAQASAQRRHADATGRLADAHTRQAVALERIANVLDPATLTPAQTGAPVIAMRVEIHVCPTCGRHVSPDPATVTPGGAP